MGGETKKRSSFDGPGERKRKCTDFLCLLLLIATWVAMTAIGLASMGIVEIEQISKGNPERLVNGMDYHGNICGETNYRTPSGTDTIDLPRAYFLPSGMAVCVESCPEENDYEKYHCKYEVQADIDGQVEAALAAGGEAAANKTRRTLHLLYTTTKQCMPHIQTRPYLGYCRPGADMDAVALDMNREYEQDNITDVSNLTIAKDEGENEFFGDAMADVHTSSYVIFGFGMGAAMGLGLLFLILMNLPGVLSTLIWSMVAAVFAALAGGGYYMRQTSQEWDAQGLKEPHEVKGLYYLSMAAYVGAGLWFFTICVIRRRIVLAIACVREASRAIACMPVITLYPVLQVLGLFLFCIPWGVFMAYLASSGEVQAECVCPLGLRRLEETIDNSTDTGNSTDSTFDNSNHTLIKDDFECYDGCYVYKSFNYDRNTQYAGLFMVFTWFWTSQFIVAVGQLVVAMSISMWYFTREKRAVGNWTFFRAMMITSVYHLGTCAFGSLIIAIIKTIRAIIMYIQKKAAKMNNKIAMVVLAAVQCCLWCIEKCMKFINKNAYIQTAIFGYSFCHGAREAFQLILRNILRISAVSLVSTMVLLIGKLFIVAGSTIGAYFYLDYKYTDQLNGLYVPILFVGLVSYAASEMFNEVFGMAIATILQCFVVDEEMLEPEDRYASGSLASTIEKTQRSKHLNTAVHPEGEEEKKALIQEDKKTTEKKKAGFVKRMFGMGGS